MTITKQTTVDLIEVLANGAVQVRTKIAVLENGNEIGASLHRTTILPGQDYSDQDARVQSVCAATHTADVIAAYEAAVAAQGV